MALRVVDRAIQSYGAEGISQDTPLAETWAHLRTLRFADGPDEVHLQQQGKYEIKDRLPYVQDRHDRVKRAEMKLGVRQHKL